MLRLLDDHAPFFGGAEAFLLDLVGARNRAEFAPHIVTDPHSPVLDDFRASDAPVLTTPLPQINRHPIFLWRLLSAGARVQRASSPIDVFPNFEQSPPLPHLVNVVNECYNPVR